MLNNSLSARFINTYNELDAFMDRILKPRHHTSHTEILRRMSEKNRVIKNNLSELKSYANLRNAIVHESTSKITPIAEPHVEIVEHYESILEELLSPREAIDIAVKWRNLKTAKLSDKIVDTIELMTANEYSYMPLIDDGKLKGVFSENIHEQRTKHQ